MTTTEREVTAAGAWRRRLVAAGLLLAALGCGTVAGSRGPSAARPTPAWIAYPEATVAAVKNPHNYLGSELCQKCHTGPEGGLRSDPVTLCKDCHPQRHGNHPVEIVQKKPSPELPYGPGGKILCHTCHDQHDMRAQKKGLRARFNDLCMKCHLQH